MRTKYKVSTIVFNFPAELRERKIKKTTFSKQTGIAMNWQTGALLAILIAVPALARPAENQVLEKQNHSPPNILFISVDDLNNWVGYLKGHPQVKTPNMDRLVEAGCAFTNAHCTTPLCQPSRTAVLTGLSPQKTKVYENKSRFDHTVYTMLPQFFAAHGYTTYGTGKVHHKKNVTEAIFQKSYMTEQRWSPFESNDVDYTKKELPSKGSQNPRHVILSGPAEKSYVMPFNRMSSERSPDDKKGESFDWSAFDLPDDAFGDSKIVDWATREIGAHGSHEPFFMAVGFYRPHIPLYAPEKYFELYPLDSIQLPTTRRNDLADIPSAGKERAFGAVTAGTHAHVIQNRQWKNAVQAYLASISFVDHQIGRLLDCLEHSSKADNTLIVLFSDHGWHLGEKQAWGKQTGWIHSTQVPLIFCGPSIQKNALCEETVSLLDLFPTLSEMAGFPTTDLDGVSLAHLLRDPDHKTGRVVKTFINSKDYVLSSKKYRYIYYGDGSEELYNVENDPREYRNLAGSHGSQKIITALQGDLR